MMSRTAMKRFSVRFATRHGLDYREMASFVRGDLRDVEFDNIPAFERRLREHFGMLEELI